MSESIPSDALQQLLELVGSKRGRGVVQHIANHGFITTEELERDYGYNHPPRAARDVREAGIPLETFRVISSDGRRIGAYRFGDLSTVRKARAGGRKSFSKPFKRQLYDASGGTCTICCGRFEDRYLQIDHRVPYEIAGNEEDFQQNSDDYMLLCRSCNRAKSWSCENCPNWTRKSDAICSRCYWAYPEGHTHIALREVRRTDILWDADEVRVYEELRRVAARAERAVPDYVKKLVAKCLKRTPPSV